MWVLRIFMRSTGIDHSASSKFNSSQVALMSSPGLHEGEQHQPDREAGEDEQPGIVPAEGVQELRLLAILSRPASHFARSAIFDLLKRVQDHQWRDIRDRALADDRKDVHFQPVQNVLAIIRRPFFPVPLMPFAGDGLEGIGRVYFRKLPPILFGRGGGDSLCKHLLGDGPLFAGLGEGGFGVAPASQPLFFAQEAIFQPPVPGRRSGRLLNTGRRRLPFFRACP